MSVPSWPEIYDCLKASNCQETDAWEALIARVTPWARKDFSDHGWLYVGEAVVETCYYVYVYFPNARGRDSFATWVHDHYRNVRRRLWRDIARNRKSTQTDDDAATEASGQDSDTDTTVTTRHDNPQYQALRECLAQLSDLEHLVVRLAHEVELSREQIAADVGKKVGYVRVILHRALIKLRHCLESRGITSADDTDENA